MFLCVVIITIEYANLILSNHYNIRGSWLSATELSTIPNEYWPDNVNTNYALFHVLQTII